MSDTSSWWERLASREATPLEPGLYVVATPIGNLEDISLRALRVLRQVDQVAAEDTRAALHLLRAYGIQQSVISLHRDNEARRVPQILQALANERAVALISEAGTPCVSDPGYLTVQAVVEAGFRVFPIPGPSAVIAALSAAGLPSHHFVFLGFLPQRRGKRRAILRTYQSIPATRVLYVSPHSVEKQLDEIRAAWGDVPACIGREITKTFEEFLHGRLSELQAILAERDRQRGEFVLLVEGASATAPAVDLEQVTLPPTEATPETDPNDPADDAPTATDDATADAPTLEEAIAARAVELLQDDSRMKQKAKALATAFPSISRREAYQFLLKLSEGSER